MINKVQAFAKIEYYVNGMFRKGSFESGKHLTIKNAEEDIHAMVRISLGKNYKCTFRSMNFYTVECYQDERV